MIDRRRKDVSWAVKDENGAMYSNGAQLAVLMDIRDELKAINRSLGCHRIPRALDALHSMGVAARRRKRKAKARK